MGNVVDDGGIRFEQVKDTWQVLDYNYGCELGTIVLEGGPGWIFKPVADFLDAGQLRSLAKFVESLPLPTT